MNIIETICRQHTANTKWENRLRFHEDELEIMLNRLDELTEVNMHEEFLEGSDHFRRHLRTLSHSIEAIREEFRSNAADLAMDILRNPIAISKRKLATQAKEFRVLLQFDKQFSELKREFHWFSSNWQ